MYLPIIFHPDARFWAIARFFLILMIAVCSKSRGLLCCHIYFEGSGVVIELRLFAIARASSRNRRLWSGRLGGHRDRIFRGSVIAFIPVQGVSEVSRGLAFVALTERRGGCNLQVGEEILFIHVWFCHLDYLGRRGLDEQRV